MSKSCKEQVQGKLVNRINDLRTLWNLYRSDPDAADPELGQFSEYGLCFDYVAKGTFDDQKRGYFRWQLSWGGPADEFRFYLDECLDPVEIEYWFLNWFDGAKVDLSGDGYELLEEIFRDFKDIGVIEAEYSKARDNC